MSDSSSGSKSKKSSIIRYGNKFLPKTVDYSMETNLRKFVEFIGSSNIEYFFDFVDELKGGDDYLSVSIEFISEKEVLVNNRVVFLKDEGGDDLMNALDNAISFKGEGEDENEDNKKTGIVYILEKDDRVKFLIKFTDEDENESGIDVGSEIEDEKNKE